MHAFSFTLKLSSQYVFFIFQYCSEIQVVDVFESVRESYDTAGLVSFCTVHSTFVDALYDCSRASVSFSRP